MNKRAIAEMILTTLEGRRFEDWYRGRFEDYIGGTWDKQDPRQPTKEQILTEIEKMFKLSYEN